MTTHNEILEVAYNEATSQTKEMCSRNLPSEAKNYIDLIISRSETNRGLLTVLITLLTHKICHPTQDIRFHQAQLPHGFAGRTIDQSYITPFMKSKSFPAMASSGWLTRSLEQAHPYDLEYPGKIKPVELKIAFLNIINLIECCNVNPKDVLIYCFSLLIEQRDKTNIDLAKPHSLSISSIVELLRLHFTFNYSCAGASRLPTLAIYAAYECMMNQVARYNEKILCPLESHTSADLRSGRIGDIDINNINGMAFEGVEIKHGIPISKQMVIDAYEKFKVYNTDRYYLLTTSDNDNNERDEINYELKRIEHIHGCQVIVNGVYSSLKYYLRLLKDTSEFIDKYVELLKEDEVIKFQHKATWNDIIASGNF